MPITYVPKPNATAKDWLGWYIDDRTDDLANKRAGLAVTEVQGDTVHMQLDDAGQQGGPVSNPIAFQLPIAALNFQTDFDLSRFNSPIDSVVVKNTVSLDEDQVTLTLLVPAAGQAAADGYQKKIRYQRKLNNSQFLATTMDLIPTNPPNAPR